MAQSALYLATTMGARGARRVKNVCGEWMAGVGLLSPVSGAPRAGQGRAGQWGRENSRFVSIN